MDYDYLFKLKEHYGNGVTESKNNVITDLQNTMSSELENNFISEYEVKIGMDFYKRNVLVNFTTPLTCVIKIERYKEIVYNSQSRTVLCPTNALSVGDYVTTNEDGITYNYIVRARPFERPTHDEVFILGCQYDVKILDDDGVTIHTYPLAFSDNKSRPENSERAETGVTENSTFQAYIKHDNISRRFIEVTGNTASGKSNKIQRILIDGLAYIIKGSDPVSLKGVITLGLELDTKSPNDNIELGIADYYNNIAPPTPEPTLQIIGDSELCISETNTYTIDTNNVVTWGITNNGVNVTLGLTGVNGECTVTAKYDTKLIGKTETLTAYLDYGATFTKTITITSLI